METNGNATAMPTSHVMYEPSPAQAHWPNGHTHIDMAHLRFEDVFDLQEIQQIQDAFARATGVASVITDTEGVPITEPSNFCDLCQLIRSTEKGLRNCMHSDAELGKVNPHGPMMQPCLSGGLWDGGTSIMVGDHHIANWLIGQVLDEDVDESVMLAYAHEIGADEASFRHHLHNVRHMSREQFSDICDALFLIARQLSRLALRTLEQEKHIEEAQRAEQERVRLHAQVVEAQQAAIRELSTPLLPLADRVVALPLVGSIDSTRAQAVMETLLEGVAHYRAEFAIVDITGVSVVDTQVAQALVNAARAVRLLGAQVVLTGIGPALAQTLVHLGADLSDIITRGNLQAGIAYALDR
jgi:ligand-binding sensor protein/anti-anti-sigma regulatory factor